MSLFGQRKQEKIQKAVCFSSNGGHKIPNVLGCSSPVPQKVCDERFDRLCPLLSDALERAPGPFPGKGVGQSSPMSDRKKNRRKKSMNQKGDGAVGQAEGKRGGGPCEALREYPRLGTGE